MELRTYINFYISQLCVLATMEEHVWHLTIVGVLVDGLEISVTQVIMEMYNCILTLYICICTYIARRISSYEQKHLFTV